MEVVAKRTIEGEGGSESAAATRYQPLNAWAWKAIGVVELVCLSLGYRINLKLNDVHRTVVVIRPPLKLCGLP